MKIFFSSLILLLALNTIWAQGSIEFYSNSSQEEFSVYPNLNPKIIASGDFGYFVQSKRGKFFGTERTQNNYIRFSLTFETVVYSDTSLFITLANKYHSVENDNTTYSYNSVEEEQENGVKDTSNLQFFTKQYYLEYRHNPLAVFKIGHQYINVADKLGIVYQGYNSGLTQSCAMGTWCYYIGSVSTGKIPGGLTFLHLSYPVYNNFANQSNLFDKPLSIDKLNVEIFTVNYRDYKLAFANYGGNTIKPSYGDKKYSIYQQKDASGNYIFRDLKWQYIGFNIDWQHAPQQFLLNVVQLSGESKHYNEPSSQSYNLIRTTKNSGMAINAQYNYLIKDNFKLSFNYFQSSGNQLNNDATTNFKSWDTAKEDKAFYEVFPGTFQKGLIYFTNEMGYGQAHSVSNLIFYNADFAFINQSKSFELGVSIFNFRRNSAILNTAGKFVSDIGREIDLKLKFNLTNGLSFKSNFSMFNTGNAYSSNENIIPSSQVENDFSRVEAGFDYNF